MDGYGEDLAYIHDVGHSDFVLGAAPGLLRLLMRAGIRGGLVVDLGCGSGQWAAELLRAGYEVLGVDVSAPMIEIARRRAPAASFVQTSFLSVPLPACAAVTSIGECLNYAFDPASGPQALAGLFTRVHAALRPGGLFMFDVALPGQVAAGRTGRRHSQGSDWAVLLALEEDSGRRLLERRMTIFRRVGRGYRRSEETHRMHLYQRSQLVRDLASADFRVRVLRGYGDFRLRPRHAAFLAVKPPTS